MGINKKHKEIATSLLILGLFGCIPGSNNFNQCVQEQTENTLGTLPILSVYFLRWVVLYVSKVRFVSCTADKFRAPNNTSGSCESEHIQFQHTKPIDSIV